MIKSLLFLSLLIHATFAQNGSWQTLDGNEPIVIARGGMSGLFPESSQFAYEVATQSPVETLTLWCDLQLTKDGVGFCQSDIRLDNSTNIATVFPNNENTYIVNGQKVRGWFAVDITSDKLKEVTLSQNIYSRPAEFDGMLPIVTVEDAAGLRPPGLWVNVQYDTFYNQRNASPAGYLKNVMRTVGINYISSPEVAFLTFMNGQVNKARTKLIFRFLDANEIEPTTRKTYSELLKDLANIKTFASGILVPKEYIWPVGANQYLEAPTTLVSDAHKLGLLVYSSGFANDMPASYNYSYDPTNEYLQFIDNSQFSIDGLLTDFPTTAANAIVCFAHNQKPAPVKGKPLVISHNGASGDYPGCTDLAYEKAVTDGADVIDCSVQLSKDGVAFCSGSADLSGNTNAKTSFMSRASTIPEIQQNNGVFSFELTWTEIQTLKPQILSAFQEVGLQRNPANKNAGKLMTLADFLQLTKIKAVQGVLINIENAAYLATKGLSISEAVSSALSNATLDKQQIFIQSDDTSVLSNFKNVPSYTRVLLIKEKISSAPKQAAEEIKKYADAVSISRSSLVVAPKSYILSYTSVVKDMHAANISVFVSVLKNEFLSLAFDYYADPMAELATLTSEGVDGLVTEFPYTATAYMRSSCSDFKNNSTYLIPPVEANSLIDVAPAEAQPPAEAPAPALDAADVVDPPLPSVAASDADAASATDPAAKAPTPSKSGVHQTNAAHVGLSLVTIVLLIMLAL
ncbi:Glycerophosphodiester phosphodiesterase domain [Dillenia turbinata]|uniref:glycerophosphodiester phosphodiesterase n=1 Tax=Dillenia turbinata TaxID=194707 RepID=A0AAN8VXT6_9MAGN